MLAPFAEAQRRVVGVVHDSLRAQGPLAGVEVVLLGGGARALTDSLGRFEFASVAATAQSIAYWAPWLDSLGLPPLRASLDAALGAAPIVLATPSRATFQRALCGATLDDGQGVLLGEVRGPDGMPQDSVLVLAEWQETAIGRGGIMRQVVATVDTTDAAGSYVLCGVPVEAAVTLQAASRARSTGRLHVRIDTYQQRLDVVVGSEDETVDVSGRVVEQLADGIVPVAGADVALLGDSAVSARSDGDGKFELRVPWRSSHLEVRAVGFSPRAVPVAPIESRLELGAVEIERVPPQLDAVAVTADFYARERAEFDFRRQRGVGAFITEEQLRRVPDVSAYSVTSFVPGTQAKTFPGRSGLRQLLIRSGSGFCEPRFFHDGQAVGKLNAQLITEQMDLLQRAKRIEIYSAAEAPPQFNDFDGCGAVVVWTR